LKCNVKIKCNHPRNYSSITFNGVKSLLSLRFLNITAPESLLCVVIILAFSSCENTTPLILYWNSHKN